ncbi:type I polyketide synthase [Acidisphaera sp. S103]|uniref:type I polyketide synthase n=1 Tax=Acidisphaera sp. S103 TaxID=1747223 RepID=UPI00131E0341|nr:type I polyketide synthase [Acidisphaera sp. S103]
MSGSTSVQADRMRRALARIEQLEAEVASLRRGERPPIGVLGIGLRLPGGICDAAGFWAALSSGSDLTSELPGERWGVDAATLADLHDPSGVRVGTVRSLRGGWLGPVDGFDAAFWGISPREAVGLDPQQRLLLECAWEALEDAAIDPLRLRGRRVGVYVGICGSDYGQLAAAGGLRGIDAYHASGTQHSVASGRIAYALGLTGPAVSVDTACSSSLVALHLALRALRAGECELALVGGVNLILTPANSVGLSRAGMLAPDGRCKAFSALGDGYGRAEGCAVVVLGRLAEASPGQVWAVLQGSALGQDGASGGLTVPNGPAQAAVIRAALADAGAVAASVGYIEAHGTGTPLGDPIEAGALTAVFGGREAPLLVGSAKTNLGHTESAAGLVGLVKAALVRHHGVVPPHPFAGQPTPHVDWGSSGLALPGEMVPLAADALVGVSSFGLSGTNAHAVLGAAPAGLARGGVVALADMPHGRHGQTDAAVDRTGVFVLSARSAASLAGLATASAERLAELASIGGAEAGRISTNSADDWAAACWTAATGRAALPWRRAVVAASAADAAAMLRGGSSPTGRDGSSSAWGIECGAAVSAPAPVLWLFTGQGALRPGAGGGLLGDPAFAEAWHGVCAAFARYLPHGTPGLHDVLHGAEAAAWLRRPSLAQPAHIALAVALTALWRARGVVPAAVLGHSLGEYAAAYVAGVLDLDGLARLVAGRGQLCDALAPGGMAATTASEAEVTAVLMGLPAGLEAEVGLAALHGAAGSTVSGNPEGLAALCEALAAAGHTTERLAGGQGYHSPLTQPAMVPLAALAAGIRHATPRIPLASTLTGEILGEVDWPSHWARHLRQPVRFAAALDNAVRAVEQTAQDEPVAMEIGPHPTLTGLARRLRPRLPTVAGLSPDVPDPVAVQRATAALWVRGVEPAWARVLPEPHRIVSLPNYTWDRVRYWVDQPVSWLSGDNRAADVGAFYDDLTTAYAALTARGLADPAMDLHLTYAPFAAVVPGFSWLETIRDPDQNPDHLELMLAAQRRMRTLAFRDVDLTRVQRVFDLGCGYGGDLVALARRFPGLRGVGHTASAKQAEVAHRLASARGVDDRVAVYHRDSTRETPDGSFDLIVGFEAVHHMADPGALFRRLETVIAPGGHLVLADLMAAGTAIADGKTLSELPAAEDWAGWLASAGLRLETATCLSEAVADFLHDDDFDANVDRIGADLPPDRRLAVQEAFRGFVRLGRLLREGGARYLLFSARRTNEAAATLRQAALDVLAKPVPYDSLAPERWLYEPVWEPAQPIRLPRPDAIAGVPAADPEMPDLAAARDALNRLARAFAAEAAGEVTAPNRMRAAGHLRALGQAAAVPADVLGERLAAAHPEAATEFALLRRCGAALPAILRGEIDPLAPLFADDSAGRLYAEAPTARRMNGLLAGLLRDATAGQSNRLRVLEVGAGTGGTTASMLAALPPGTEYVFTDVSPALLARAAARFPQVRTEVLDVERDPTTQGFGGAKFDIIVAANVLHACRDIPAALSHLFGLLAPGGWLALLEGIKPAAWVDATFGLTDGWWRFDDALRVDHPLLPVQAWRAAVDAAGLRDTAVLRSPEALLLDQAVIVAQRPLLSERVAVLGDGDVVRAVRDRIGGRDLADGDVVLDLRALGRPDTADGMQAAAADALALLQGATDRRVWLATCGWRDGTRLAGSPLWGLGLVAGLEQDGGACRLIDLDPADPDPAATLVAALAAEDDEDRTAWHGGIRYVQRLRRRPWPQPAERLALKDGAWLITGGRGGLGLAVASWLADRGARDLVLAGRSAPGPEALALVERLRERGVSVALPRTDVSVAAEVAGLVEGITQRTRLAGVVHAAGVVADAALRHMDAAMLAKVMAPKAAGALHLHRATVGLPPHHFVLFASVAGVMGNAGQANHAAANAVLDTVAWHRRGLGLHALSIDWGIWRETGIAAARGGVSMTGVSGLGTDDALSVLERLLAEDATQAVVLPVDWAAFGETRGPMPLLRHLVTARAAGFVLPETADLGETVALLAAQVLGMAALPDTHAPLAGFGFDSLMAIALRNRLRDRLGVDLPLVHLVGEASAASLATEVATLLEPAGISSEVAAMSDAEVEAALRVLSEAAE